MEIKEFRKAMSSLRFIWVLGNEYIASSEPWKVIKEDRLYAETIMNISINLIRIFATLSKPIIPFSAKKILDMLNISDFSDWIDCNNILSEISFIKEGYTLNQNYILFKRIEDEEISDFIQRFG
jgi:methionyl-tRNA synthetase